MVHKDERGGHRSDLQGSGGRAAELVAGSDRVDAVCADGDGVVSAAGIPLIGQTAGGDQLLGGVLAQSRRTRDGNNWRGVDQKIGGGGVNSD